MSWVGDLLRAGINAKADSLKITKPLEFDTGVELPKAKVSLSAADQTDGTADLTVQIQDPAGNDLAISGFVRVWTGGADDYGVDALTGITATTGTIVESTTANGDLDVVTDANGTAVLALNNGGAGSIYVWAAYQGQVFETGEVTITST
jgi:hypothetical protein